jgi:CRISPR/Cas system-associated endonuclease Cas1
MEVSKSGGEFIVKYKGQILKRLPSFYVNSIVVMANVQITHAVIVEMLKMIGAYSTLINLGDC